jgi:hypothetical protein
MTPHLLALSGPEIKDESTRLVQDGGITAPRRAHMAAITVHRTLNISHRNDTTLFVMIPVAVHRLPGFDAQPGTDDRPPSIETQSGGTQSGETQSGETQSGETRSGRTGEKITRRAAHFPVNLVVVDLGRIRVVDGTNARGWWRIATQAAACAGSGIHPTAAMNRFANDRA